jgi:hypothetical protein
VKHDRTGPRKLPLLTGSPRPLLDGERSYMVIGVLALYDGVARLRTDAVLLTILVFLTSSRVRWPHARKLATSLAATRSRPASSFTVPPQTRE